MALFFSLNYTGRLYLRKLVSLITDVFITWPWPKWHIVLTILYYLDFFYVFPFFLYFLYSFFLTFLWPPYISQPLQLWPLSFIHRFLLYIFLASVLQFLTPLHFHVLFPTVLCPLTVQCPLSYIAMSSCTSLFYISLSSFLYFPVLLQFLFFFLFIFQELCLSFPHFPCSVFSLSLSSVLHFPVLFLFHAHLHFSMLHLLTFPHPLTFPHLLTFLSSLHFHLFPYISPSSYISVLLLTFPYPLTICSLS